MSELNKLRKEFTQILSQKLVELKATYVESLSRIKQLNFFIALLERALKILKDERLRDEEALATSVAFYDEAVQRIPELKALAEEVERYCEKLKYVS